MAENRLTAVLAGMRLHLDTAQRMARADSERIGRIVELAGQLATEVADHFETCDSDRIRREVAAQFYRQVRQLMSDYEGPPGVGGRIAAMAFGASLDQVAVEMYGLTEEEMGDA